MAYTGNDQNLQDLQEQINALHVLLNQKAAGLQTQIKQVTLTLEGELKTLKASFDALVSLINSKF